MLLCTGVLEEHIDHSKDFKSNMLALVSVVHICMVTMEDQMIVWFEKMEMLYLMWKKELVQKDTLSDLMLLIGLISVFN